MGVLWNLVDARELKKRLMEEPFERTTLSFYRYARIENPVHMRDQLYREWSDLQVFGRIYLAPEGINAQMSVPTHNYEAFVAHLHTYPHFIKMPLKIAIEDNGKSFYKLTIKIRKKIVADGLDDHAFDTSDVGTHLDAEAFNTAMENPDTLVVDMRNHYESEIGRFEGAICPEAETFRQELPMVRDMLKGKEDKKILLYCTGGIRCEKASAYLRHHGFRDVNQLHGGIIEYARQVKAKNLPCRFKGKNFVFDERCGERITDDILSTCHQCGTACDTHTNCAHEACHLLFIQCEECSKTYEGCCSTACKAVITSYEASETPQNLSHKNSDWSLSPSR